jgi:GNAT superfamily N-acetyltransferase
MKIFTLDTNNSIFRNKFLNLPFQIYRDCSQWVPPLESDARRMLDLKRHPFYRHSDAAFFLAEDEAGEAVGRIAVLDNRHYNEYNHEKTAFFYLFECVDDLDVSRGLFNAAFDWARKRGLNLIKGPKGFTALDGMGLLIQGFEHMPAMGIPYNHAYYQKLVEDVGFLTDGDVVSGYLKPEYRLPEKVRLVAERVQARLGLSVERFTSRADLRAFVPRLKELYNESLPGTVGNTPLTDKEAKVMAEQIIWFANPRLIKILKKGEQIVGFLFAYPDVSAALQRTKGKLFPFGWIDLLLELKRTTWIDINGAGIIEEYRGMGGTAILFSEMEKTVLSGTFTRADVVQIGVDNQKMQMEMAALGLDFCKMHRNYRRAL